MLIVVRKFQFMLMCKIFKYEVIIHLTPNQYFTAKQKRKAAHRTSSSQCELNGMYFLHLLFVWFENVCSEPPPHHSKSAQLTSLNSKL